MIQIICYKGDDIASMGIYIDCDGEIKTIVLGKYNQEEILFKITDNNGELLWKGKCAGWVNKILAEVLIDKYERVERGLC